MGETMIGLISSLENASLYRDIKQEMKEIYLQDDTPICLMSSHGKDSTLQLQLIWEVLSELAPWERHKTVHIVTGDTLVEVPAMLSHIKNSLKKIQLAAIEQGLPIQVHLAEPEMKGRFFYQALGKGNPVPNERSRYRWCTDKTKIQPTDEIVESLIAENPKLLSPYDMIMFLAVRVLESNTRKQSIEKFAIDESKFANHAVHKRVLVYHPIKYLSKDDVWNYLLNKSILGWGADAHDLYSLYVDASAGECQLTMAEGKQARSCGSSRFGCWPCLYAGRSDKMLSSLVEIDKQLLPLLQWKITLYDIRNDARYRYPVRRREEGKLKNELAFEDQQEFDLSILDDESEESEWAYAVGSLTVEARKKMLEYLLYVELQSGYQLIDQEEVDAIVQEWKSELGSDEPITVGPWEFDYDGPVVFDKSGKLNEKETKNLNHLFEIQRTFSDNIQRVKLDLYQKMALNDTGIFWRASKDERDHRILFYVSNPYIQSMEDAEWFVDSWLTQSHI